MSEKRVLHNISKMLGGYDIDDGTRNEQIVKAIKDLNSVLVANGLDPIAGIKFTPNTLQQIADEFDASRFINPHNLSVEGCTYANVPLIL